MSTFPTLIIFDYKKLVNDIIPAFIQGENHTLIKDEILFHNQGIENSFEQWTDFPYLKDVISYYDNTFLKSSIDKSFVVDSNGVHFSKIEGITPCWGFETLSDLFERVLVRHSALYFANLGRTYSIDFMVKSDNKQAQQILNKLNDGAEVWNRFGEGIRGWISNIEVGKLHEYLTDLTKQNNQNKAFKTLKKVMSIAYEGNYGVIHGQGIYLNIEEDSNAEIIELYAQKENYPNGEPCFLGKKVI